MMNDDGDAPELEPIDVSAAIEATAERLRRTHPGVRVTVDTPGSVYATAGSQIDRVFANLIENAVSHGGDDPMLRVTVEEMTERVVVRVADTGPGIPPDERERLFVPPESGDHGYGLFLNRTLVEMYGGRLDLADTGPEGSVFEVRLRPATPTGEAFSGDSDDTELVAA